MNCANCGKEIYGTIDGCWFHIGKRLFCDLSNDNRNIAEPNIHEVRKGLCKHCGGEIHFDEYSQRWGHFIEGGIHKGCLYEYCYGDLNPKFKAEPKRRRIILDEVKAKPTDCIKCDHICYKGCTPFFADKAVCLLGRDTNDSDWLFPIFNGRLPDCHTPPSWCPKKAKEPEKTYPIKLKKCSVTESFEFLIDKYDRGKLSVEALIDAIRGRIESEPIEHPNAMGYEKCRACGGKGYVAIKSNIKPLDMPRGIPCPKCSGTGIQSKDV